MVAHFAHISGLLGAVHTTQGNKLKQSWNPDNVMQLAGWDGPAPIEGGVHRYSKTLGWIRMYIEIDGQEFHGGVTGASENFEIALEEGEWKCFDTKLACTPSGDIVLKLINCTTLDLVFERVGKGTKIQEAIETIDDLAAYLEKSVFSSSS